MRRNQSGATVVVVISVIATLAVFTGAALDYTFTVGRNVERSDKMAQATSIANGCIQNEFMYWREICRSLSSTTQGPPTSSFANIPLPTQSQFPNISNFTATTGSGSSYTVSNYSVVALTPQLQVVSGSSNPTAGIGETATTKTYFYRATATVTLADRGLPVTFNASQVFEQQYQNPWEWALFFADPLEIHPGPPFTITGWVQTNSSLYTGMASLTFGDKVNYGTNWYIGFMPGDGDHNGDTPAPPTWPANLPPSQSTPTQPFGLSPTSIFNANDPNYSTDGYHELIQVPNPAYPDPLQGQRYFDQAGVKIILSSNGGSITATIYDNSSAASTSSLGTTIGTVTYSSGGWRGASTTSTASRGDSTYQKNLFNTFSSALTLNQSIQDNREGTTVAITQINVGTVTTAVNNGTLAGFNQVVYIDDSSAASNNERAVELTNGSVLPTNGLTFASANPVYIQGDYNTGSNPPSDSGNSSQPTASGYTRQPSSVIADAVDILSNAWTNSNSTSSLSSRTATSTTINAAIVYELKTTHGGHQTRSSSTVRISKVSSLCESAVALLMRRPTNMTRQRSSSL